MRKAKIKQENKEFLDIASQRSERAEIFYMLTVKLTKIPCKIDGNTKNRKENK